MDIKKQNLMLISNPVKKGAKKLCEKSYQQKSDRKIGFLTCKNCVQKFSAYTFFVGCFLHFFQRFQNSTSNVRFMIPISTIFYIYFVFITTFC
jgi:hypothetical protein